MTSHDRRAACFLLDFPFETLASGFGIDDISPVSTTRRGLWRLRSSGWRRQPQGPRELEWHPADGCPGTPAEGSWPCKLAPVCMEIA